MRTSCETMNITGKNPSATPRKALLSMIRCGHQVEILDRRRRDSHDRTRVVFALGVRPRCFHHCRHLVFLVYRPDRPYHGRRGIAHRFPHSERGPACVALPCINGVGERNARFAAAHPLRTCATHRRPARPACPRSSVACGCIERCAHKKRPAFPLHAWQEESGAFAFFRSRGRATRYPAPSWRRRAW